MHDNPPTYDEMFPALEPIPPNCSEIGSDEELLACLDPADSRLSIRCGGKDRAPTWRPKIGETHYVRFLRFGASAALIQLIYSHQIIHRRGLVCPRRTSPDLGGDKTAPCPLCDILAEPSWLEHEWLIPKPYIRVPTFVLRVGRLDGGKRVYETEFDIRRPYQLWLPSAVAKQLHLYSMQYQHVADYERGTVFEVTIHSKDAWKLTPFMSGQLFYSLPPMEMAKRYAWIEGYLVEPEVRIATLEELEEAKRVLFAYRDAPERDDPRFWDQMMAASLPEIQLPRLVPTPQLPTLPRTPSKPKR